MEIEQIESFLTKLGVKWERPDLGTGFNRTISFNIYGVDYQIIWFINRCKLVIPNHSGRNAQIPFYELKLDTVAPIAHGENLSIKFLTSEDDNYECFRIPLEI